MAQNPKITHLGEQLLKSSLDTLSRKNLEPKDWEAVAHVIDKLQGRLDHWGSEALKRVFLLAESGFRYQVSEALEELATKPKPRKPAPSKGSSESRPGPALT